MDSHPFGLTVNSLQRLRELIPEPSPLVLKKVIPTIDDHVRRLISHASYVVLSTCDASGVCDASPRGGAPGFVQILDEQHLLLPEATGNRRADTMCNLLENPSIGMIFLVPGYDETLRINGTAVITEDPAVLGLAAINDKAATIALGIRVQECYIHCAKAALRSSMWNPMGWPDLTQVPSAAQILRDHTGASEGDGSVEYMQEVLDESYTKRL